MGIVHFTLSVTSGLKLCHVCIATRQHVVSIKHDREGGLCNRLFGSVLAASPPVLTAEFQLNTFLWRMIKNSIELGGH